MLSVYQHVMLNIIYGNITSPDKAKLLISKGIPRHIQSTATLLGTPC